MLILGVVVCTRLGHASDGRIPLDTATIGEPIQPIPQSTELPPQRVALGERLFHDVRLSKTNTLACATCHIIALGGMDRRARSRTAQGEPDVINTPTVFNTAFNFRQTWRGEFRTLEEQAEADLSNPRHANTDWDELLSKLRAIPEYRRDFSKSYGGDVTRETVLDALATYQRSLITPDAAFDRFLRGENKAISSGARRGYQLFKSYGCVSCHQGVNVGGNMFQKLGIFRDYFTARGNVTMPDLGRFNVTGQESDRHVFKVPSLRNVALTAPYLHDGSIATLEEAIQVMGRYQLDRELPAQDVMSIAAFLRTLTGQYQGKTLADTP
ncbi:MAG: c-type cytochrome [Pseudomonadota bacterium]|nr:MAG: c-type cytochrome [Pseudomonadota bacterium]